MPLTIRRAVPADAAVVTEFNRLLAEESEGKVLDRPTLAAGVRAALTDPGKALYFVAETNENILGQIMLTTEWSDWRNGWVWWIQSVYVRPEVRRQGIFRALFEHVAQTAREDPGVIALGLYVDRDNRAALATYARVGMEPTNYLVYERYPL